MGLSILPLEVRIVAPHPLLDRAWKHAPKSSAMGADLVVAPAPFVQLAMIPPY